MAQVKILITGYSSLDSPQKGACSTISLIRDKNLTIIVDPGSVKDPNLIIKALNKEKLETTDVNFVGLTHSHLDHYHNLGLFLNAKTIDYWGLWDRDQLNNYQSQFTKDIKILKTPGHSDDSISFLIKTEEGIVAICGDVFWKNYLPKKDSYANNQKKLTQSRSEILKLADYIIPGHGKMFRTK